ncbi:MAG TPA: hypothetical protein G4O12_01530 [Dehalococcoidia bacterium]|nr:hypothetical protein [Dehalococcoidia bacterium]
MKKLIFPILVILLMTAGCMPVVPAPANQLPIAYMDSVSPTKVSPGGKIAFEGHGTDPDGTVVAYRWRSSIDGELSTSASFDTTSLSEGTHTIYFKVQDSSGDWSREIYCHITVLPGGPVAPVIDSFDASPGVIAEGESLTLSWDVSGAVAVSIAPGIGNVALAGTRVVSPTKTTSYTLTATNEVGSVMSTIQVVVTPVPLHTVELFSVAAEDGHVKKNGETGPDPNVGDTPSNVAMQAFLSFDISMIPTGATIKSASLDLTTGDIFGSPFTRLGWMQVFSDQYGSLDSDDFVIAPGYGAIDTTRVRPTQPISCARLVSAIQTQVDDLSSRFQVRVQFERYSFNNREADYLALGAGKPRLVIEYED